MCCAKSFYRIILISFICSVLFAESGVSSAENGQVAGHCKLCKEYRKDTYGNTITIQIPAEYPDPRETFPNSGKSVCIPCDCGNGVLDVIDTDHQNTCPNNICGDPNKPDDTSEQCDDGNNVGFDGCTANCRKEVCGDGILQPINFDRIVEKCDEGINNSNTKDKCRTNCELPKCGDSIIDSNEDCDLGSGNADGLIGCDTSCKTVLCGDGKITGAEVCDDGNTSNNDLCTNSCLPAKCGDGIVHEGIELCDGTSFSSSIVQLPGMPDSVFNAKTCDASCKPIYPPYCGDKIVNGSEQCDDGNLNSGDGCDATCNTECTDDSLPSINLAGFALNTQGQLVKNVPLNVKLNPTCKYDQYFSDHPGNLGNKICKRLDVQFIGSAVLNASDITVTNGGTVTVAGATLPHTTSFVIDKVFNKTYWKYIRVFHGWYHIYTLAVDINNANDLVPITVTAKNACGEKTITAYYNPQGAVSGYVTNVHATGTASPVSLLTHDHDFTSINMKKVKFKLDAKQVSDETLWFNTDLSPLLVIDKERTGKILDGQQLFGTWTDGKEWSSGYEALASRDINKDHKLTGEELKDIRLWKDSSGDGVSDDGEVTDLDSEGIIAISTVSDIEKTIPLHRIKYLISNKGFTKNINGKITTGKSVDWFVPELSKESFNQEVARLTSTGYQIYQVKETPKWELNHNDIDSYLLLEPKTLKGILVSALHSVQTGESFGFKSFEYSLTKKHDVKITDKLPGNFKINLHDKLVIKDGKIISGKRKINVFEGKKVVETLDKDLLFEDISTIPAYLK